MSVTVRLIFWGLIGFVPNEDISKGMTAVMANTGVAHVTAECPIPNHAPRVWLLEGGCAEDGGQCIREPKAAVTRAAEVNLPRPRDLMGSQYKLRWWLDGDHLEITKGTPVFSLAAGVRSQVSGAAAEFPGTSDETADFSWVPDMEVLTSGQGAIDDDCLGAATTCPISARFKVWSGTAKACHLLHKTSPGGIDRVGAFVFNRSASGESIQEYQQAVADAVLVEFTVPGDDVELQAWDFSKTTQKAKAKLTPSRNGVITLLIGHWEDPTSQRPSASCHQALLFQHSDVFFDLLATRPLTSYRRNFAGTSNEVSPGLCENELETFQLSTTRSLNRLERDFRSLRSSNPPVPPHISRECDNRKFKPNGKG